MGRRIKMMGRLSAIVSEALEQTGVTWAALSEVAEDRPRILIPRPPLFTDAELNGEPLDPFVHVDMGVRFDDYLMAYEVFIANYVATATRSPPHKDLRHTLQLQKQDAEMLFGQGAPGRPMATMRDNAIRTIPLAALAHYNYAGKVYESTNSFVVVVHRSGKDYRFGVESNEVISNYGPRLAVKSPMIHATSLWRAARGSGATVRKPDTLSLLWSWLGRETSAASYDEKKSLRLALEILFWRGGARQHALISSGVRERASPDSWLIALSMAEDFERFESPYRQLFSIFVPNLLTKREFVKTFGERPRMAGKPNESRRRIWRMSLDYLKSKAAEKSQ